ncbi:site-specific DNA-methyltransferase [Parapedobacter sp. 10938]|uniref:site-specific DNA-methyltransferase n=1 Tax=Parapedobacter flavus TaxID=3110225 RepID=UPI002DBA268C|nr:site-specific DNA-methyltransferase [Parapedobacter sp. 10938]MEC3880254.1 site-specific DNA-methyltransferase [Parapedobacter sp. 10938]
MNIEKLDLQSPDLVNANFEKLAALFPNCVTESAEGKAIDFDLLKQELNHAVVEGNKERYRLEWPGKKEAIVTANIPTTQTLRPVREDSVDFDNTENIYIEGDNLEVLKLLQESYLGKIKMIYIDPPYNTGNDFVYKDNFVNDIQEELFESGQRDEYNQRLVVNLSTSGRYHSDWITLMYPRLKLARNLLTEDGLIFISIDDIEITNLRKICDEIFGDINFVSQIIWKSKYGAGAKTTGFIDVHEYILCYSRNPLNNIESPLGEELRNSYNKKDNKFKTRGGYFTQPLMTNSLGDRPNLQYSIFYNNTEIKPKKQWVWSKERLEQAIANDEVVFSLQKDGTYSVRSKQYLKDENGLERKGKPLSVLIGPYTQDGTKDISNLFNRNPFGFVKPVDLIKHLLSFTVNSTDLKNDIILDFFSGSATTGHAAMQLNSEDKGNRKYIMVQLPEPTDEKSEAYKAGYKNICEIGKERIRRAAKKIKEETGADIDYGFRVYRLDESNMQDVYYRPQDYNQGNLDLFADNVKPDRTPDDLLAQVMLDWGLALSLKIEQVEIAEKQVFKVAGDSLYACFDRGIDEDFAKAIAKEKPLRIVFRDNGFKDDTAKTNVKQLLKQLSPETEMKVI